MRELLPQTPRRAPLQNLDEFGHRHLRRQLDEQMHMIGHRLDLDHHPAELGDQITWYFTENTDLRVDRYCMNLTINHTYDNNGPLRGPKKRDRLSPE